VRDLKISRTIQLSSNIDYKVTINIGWAAKNEYLFVTFACILVTNHIEFTHILYTLTIAAPRLRPLFKDKQIVEGSDGCGLFVDNFFF
jgi:hypothetical protein